ncbi:DUF2254 domain-containing protein [Lichenicola cladoniae]|uniref:DUF2254 domain-containing protein n=1 Tax=Lichenicola cladoniae TaxID=1484109 RepID=A0A6M8HLM9_9PROT|nr:DUF2254 domain-containing protein [Lichenicola cladoniae]NPD70219.1 DUF2254 domain-containing protein [Acetobacteraceae bacterium]QKE89257.1 DUF2254 domain-containing protein [Lichenicola cladoniae]
MIARLRKFFSDLGERFWVLPALMVLCGILGAVGVVHLDRSGVVPEWLIAGPWLYNGGATGARTLLGAVASSTIGVAGTVFSITIAALSLAAGQMGPRLLRNFTRDRGNQFTLGTFLGTFSFSLMVLRSVRTPSEGEFVPHLSLTISIVLAFVSVGTLVFFVGHMAGRINVDTVIELVSLEVRSGIARLTTDHPQPAVPDPSIWNGADIVSDARQGYLQQLEGDGLADWAAKHRTAIRLLVRPGDYVFPGAAIAVMIPLVDGAEAAIRDATALGAQRVSSADLEFALRQLVEVAVRALSPGINDPHTAMSVLDRLGAALCELEGRHLGSGVFLRQDRPVLVVPRITYDGLCDGMFNLIRQNAAGSVAVLIRILEVLVSAAGVETVAERLDTLQRHAALVLDDATRSVANPDDLDDLRQRHHAFMSMRRHGPAGPAVAQA